MKAEQKKPDIRIRQVRTDTSVPCRKKVAAYCRVSTGKDAMLHSLSALISHYSAYIQSQPAWEYVGVYADEAYTGTKGERPRFCQMLSDCRAGKIDLILTKSISRFARNTVTMLETVREFKALGVDVYFEEQNIHSISGDGELMLTILASFAQEESKSVSDNCKWRIRKDFSEGKPINLKYAQKGKPCPSPHVREEEIKAAFERALGRMLERRSEIFSAYETMIASLTDTARQERELERTQARLDEINLEMEHMVCRNAKTAQNQDEYNREFEALSAKCGVLKEKILKLKEQLTVKAGRKRKLEAFIDKIKNTTRLISFDEQLFAGTVEQVIVNRSKTKNEKTLGCVSKVSRPK